MTILLLSFLIFFIILQIFQPNIDMYQEEDGTWTYRLWYGRKDKRKSFKL